MSKIFEKHETLFCMLLIFIYITVNSVCVQNFGYTSSVSFVVNTVLSACLVGIVLSLKKSAYYGFTKVRDLKKYLYFIPLAVIVSANLWNGFNATNTTSEIVFHILTMINIGFIEELIFRGFLFRMMEKNNVRSAIIVSAVTFGVGHIINLLNGAEIIPTLMQICYATAIGYLFVMIFHKSKSLVPCIITHCLVNSLSIFNVENTLSLYIAPVFLTVVPIAYAIYISLPQKETTLDDRSLTDEYIRLSELNLPAESLPTGSKMLRYGDISAILSKDQLQMIIESNVDWRAMHLYSDCLTNEQGFTLVNTYGLTDMTQEYLFNGHRYSLEYFASYGDESIFFHVKIENGQIPKCFFEAADRLLKIDITKYK